jgi:hypothetical protein
MEFLREAFSGSNRFVLRLAIIAALRLRDVRLRVQLEAVAASSSS